MKHMSSFQLPQRLLAQSISDRELVLPPEAALEAIAFLEAQDVHILGWEGWVKDAHGRVGHGAAPQGTVSLESLPIKDAAELCRATIAQAVAQWSKEHPGAEHELHVCITF